MNGSGTHPVARVAMPIVFVWLAVAALVVSLFGLASPALASHAGGDTTTLHPLTEGSVMLDGALDASYAQVATLAEDGVGEAIGSVYMVYNEEGCAVDNADAGDRELCVFIQLLGGRTIDDDAQLRFRTAAGMSLAERGVAYNADRSAVEFAVRYTCVPGGEGVGLSFDFSNAGATEDEARRARLAGQTETPEVGLTIACPQAVETPTPTPTPTPTQTQLGGTGTPAQTVAGGRGAPAATVIPNTASNDRSATQPILVLTAVLLLGSAATLATHQVAGRRTRP